MMDMCQERQNTSDIYAQTELQNISGINTLLAFRASLAQICAKFRNWESALVLVFLLPVLRISVADMRKLCQRASGIGQ